MSTKLTHLVFVYLLLVSTATFSANQDVPLPQVYTTDSISYTSGGIGLDERAAMQRVGSEYNLRLQFAVRNTGKFLASTSFTIVDALGNKVERVSEGPWVFAKLPPGPCKVIVKEGSKTQTRTVNITAHGHARLDFYLAE